MEREQTECQKLAARFETMAAAGLVDVKFYLQNTGEAAKERVCGEVNRLYEALGKGECSDLDFGDLQP